MSASTKRVPTRYFVRLLDTLQAQAVDTAQLLQMAGVDEAQFRRTDAGLMPLQIDALITAARRLTGRSDLGFLMGTLVKMNAHDILGYGMLSCRDVDQMLRLASRYYHLMNELFTLRYRRTAELGESLYSQVTAMPLEMLRFILEALAVIHHNHIQLLLGADLGPYDIVLIVAALALPCAAIAQVTQETVRSLGVPDATPTRIGTLRFKDGAPTADTAARVYDTLDFTRALNVYNNSLRGASALAIVKGFESIGAKPGDVAIFSDLMDSSSLFLTANADTIYYLAALDLSKGPVVVEQPTDAVGTINDMWFSWIIDIGTPGPDRGLAAST